MNTQEFIAKANIVHNNRYRYSKESEYKNQQSIMTIICEKHGVFQQTAKVHLRGSGCPECGKERRAQKRTNNFDDFVKKARKVHGDKYEYVRESFSGLRAKILVVCPKHGQFEQSARGHLDGRGCSKCAREINKEKHMKTFDYFLENARLAHGDKYRYIEESFDGMQNDIRIICPEHGEFAQRATRHAFENCGCPECGKQKMGDAHRKSFDHFLNLAQAVHGDRYQYKEETYIGMREKITVICPVHGEFEQIATNHVNGQGCPICRESKLERQVSQYLKDAGYEFEEQKTFDWLINSRTGKNLFGDFYIPSLNLLIECHGSQHFSFDGSFCKTMEEYEENMWRDDEKYRLCKEHGVNIIYFADDKPYVEGYRYPVITNIDELIAA